MLFVRSLLARVLAALRFVKCPQCQSSHVAVRAVKREFEQCDGFSGLVCRCKSCGNRWILTRDVPVI